MAQSRQSFILVTAPSVSLHSQSFHSNLPISTALALDCLSSFHYFTMTQDKASPFRAIDVYVVVQDKVHANFLQI